MDQCLVLLKMWTPTFDGSQEWVDVVPIWVRFPGLPRKYWSEDNFTSISNLLGTFLEADMSFKITKLHRVVRILVNINVREGLFEKIHLSWGNTFFKQRLDYENIPFRCRRCHTYCHLAAECSLGVRMINGRGSQKGS